MKYFFANILFLILLVSAHLSVACQTAKPLADRIGEIAENHAANDNFSGSVLVAKKGEPIYQKTFGFAEREKKRLFEAQTPSTVASIGKTLTAVLVMQLVERGKLSLSDPISKFLPQSKIPNADRITVHHLLTHTTGIANYMMHPNYTSLRLKKFAVDAPVTLDELMEIIPLQPLGFETPGSRYEYSNSNFLVLGKIIEVVTEKKYSNVLKEKILQPLKMTNTFYDIDQESFKKMAQGYTKSSAADEWRTDVLTKPISEPDCGIYTTAEDLLKFDRALFSGKLVRPETFETMKKNRVEGVQPGLGKVFYGYGLMMFEYEGGAYSMGHNGGWIGYNAEYTHYFIGKDEYTVIIISNTERRTRPLWTQIQKELLNTALKSDAAANQTDSRTQGTPHY